MRNNINIVWEVGEHKLGIFGRQRKDQPSCNGRYDLSLFISRENQIVALLFLVVVSPDIWCTEILSLWTLIFLV